MIFLLRWIQKRRQERQHTKETKVLEAKRRIQREKRSKQQAQTLLLTLQELQRTMDPLIAAHVYNNRFCPFGLLPEELFLRNRVPRRRCCYTTSSYRETAGAGSAGAGTIRIGIYASMAANSSSTRAYPTRHCYACHTQHGISQFSYANQQPFQRYQERRCLGQQGSVQLCEHVQIAWATIKAHIDDWRQQQHGKGDWQACLDSFNIECHDASHDIRCTASEAPTWPRARLCTENIDPEIVLLTMEWTPHSRMDALSLSPWTVEYPRKG
ncbi:hypothetical protein P280DRAFT_510812 [Massarina eburnea CBS 473.64]|uniref:Uncharacterized protein n=1 Tax=Massarina eburnea CBS 473.64 TaxID=1395130 RepID=A0A6A6RL21_9PLEO|nr:hypothetical protein P280DRAFT_510812 [Massarina eburnea CBS 473.64]